MVRNGRYQSASEAVRDAIRLLQERGREEAAKLRALREAVLDGIAALDRGDYQSFDSAEELARHLREISGEVLTPRDS
jgi:antitoxin ParD1/3/4